jgi:hypothetical protein
MKKQSTEIADRIQRAVKSGKLKPDGSYTISTLAGVIGTTRGQLRDAVNREFGSVAAFYTHIGFGAKEAKVAAIA